ncbi:hypothetical protein OG625_36340 [Streptomyces sp. NBC_01351]|uniref:hypothetical protein n=1 Tax=Streptomyces sp. NBC_01351 TaxID=2903833 RepID=UPI002E3266A5|nr:hypothetical protein [Streptomyces sp. NBC_01351]
MDEAEEEGSGSGPSCGPGGAPCSESAGHTFHGPTAVQNGALSTQINYFGGRRHDPHEGLLAEYLVAAADASKEHPYPTVLAGSGPSLDDVYVPQRLGSLAEGELPPEPAAIERILTNSSTCAVLAGAGGGKSSLLRTLLAMGVARQLSGADDGPVPVLVPAAALEGRSLSKALALAVQLELKGLVRTLPPDLFQVPPKPRAYWLVLVDELDEIADPTRRRGVLSALMAIERNQRELRQGPTQKAPQYRFVIATRPLPDGELDVLGPEVPRYELERFQLTDLEDVAHRWFGAYGLSEPSRHAHLFVADLNRSHLAGLARIPLTASLLCQLRAAAPADPLPGVRGEIYAEFAGLLHKRQYSPAEPGSARELSAGLRRYGEAAVARAEHTLGRLPGLIDHLAAQRRDGSRLKAVEIVGSHPDAEPPPYPVPPDVWQEFLATALSHSGFLTLHAGDHVFAHQTLMEYCAARHTTRSPRARPLQRILAQWRSADPSYVGFVIDTASPKARRKAMAKLYRMTRRGGLDGCLFLAELARLGTGLPGDLLDRVARGLTNAAQNRREQSDRTRAVVALTRLPGRVVREALPHLVQSGALNGTALVAAIGELLELGDPQVREMLHNLAVSDAQYSSQRLWAAEHLAALDDPRHPDALYVLAVSERAGGADRTVAAERLAARQDPRAADAHHAIATCTSAGGVYRAAAAEKLKGLQDPRLPDVMYALARDPRVDSSSRQRAARRVVAAGDPRIADLLLVLARDSDLGESFRRWAARELSAMRHPCLPDVLYSLACDTGLDGRARVMAAWDLVRTGDDRGRELLRSIALAKPGRTAFGAFWEEETRSSAASALAALGSPDAPEIFRTLARDGSRSYIDRRFSVRQLADLPDSRAADVLQSLVADVALPSSVRTEAAFELADLGDPRGTDVLQSLVLDTTLEVNVRAFVLRQLWEHADERVPEVLRNLAARETLEDVYRSRAVAALAKRKEACVPDLLFSVAAGTGIDESTRTMAARALMARGDGRASEQLRVLAADSTLRPGTRETAIAWLGRADLPRARAVLYELASSSDLESDLRYSAARTLALHDARLAAGALIALALDADALPRVRSAAAYNLTDQGDPRGLDLLCSLARDGIIDDEHRFEAAQDLADLRDPRGPDLMYELALDTGLRSFTRRAAVRRLARHKDPRLPALLRALAGDPTLDGTSRLVMVRRLTQSGDPAGPELLRRLANDPALDAEVRSEAAKEVPSPTSPAALPERKNTAPAPGRQTEVRPERA